MESVYGFPLFVKAFFEISEEVWKAENTADMKSVGERGSF